MHMFLVFVCSTLGPMLSPDTVPNFSVSQWDHTSSMVGNHNHVSITLSQRDCVSQSTLSHDNLANRCGWRSLSHSSQLSETRHVSGNTLLKCFLFCTGPPAAVRNHLRGCLFKQDMSAGDDANCCSGNR